MDSEKSKPLSPGLEAPDFTLTDVLSGVELTLADFRGKVVVLNFWSGDCPWTRHYDDYFAERSGRWSEQGIRLLHVDSNATETPGEIEQWAYEMDIAAPILHDASGEVAAAYGAQVTPHVFVVTPEGRLAYQGAVDDRSFRQEEPTVNYLDRAVEAVKAGRPPDPAETPAYGCAIVRGVPG